MIDTNGDFLIQPELWNWCRFKDSVAPLANKNGKWGVIDKGGIFLIQPIYDTLGVFEDGLAMVRLGELSTARYGYIDWTGTEVIPLHFQKAKYFSQGLAAVKVADSWGYILPSGDFKITPRFAGTGKAKRWPDTRAGSFVNGLAPVWVGQDSYRFIDITGSFAFEGRFDDANSFSEGLAVVKKGDRYGYIDTEGQIAIECRFIRARDFSEGLAKIEVEEFRGGHSSSYGFIDYQGRIVIQPKLDKADSFRYGLCLVTTKDSIGYIDKSGNFIWQGPYVDYGVVF